MNNKIIAIMIVCLGMIVATAGCTGLYPGSSDTRTSSQDVWTSETRMVSTGSAVPVPAMTQAPSYVGSAGVAAIDTKIIKTAALNLEVKDIPGSIEMLKTIATEKGGYLSSTNMQKGYDSRLSATVTIRVPASQFDTLLAGAKALGTVKSVSTQGQDVTEEYVDLTAQKTSYQNQLAQYNEIMKKSVKVEDILNVQEHIDRVQTELNRLEGRLKYLDSRIDLSTVTVNLQEPEPVGGDTGHNFVATINEGIAGFLGMIDAIIIIFITLLPIIIMGGTAYGIYRWKKGKKQQVAPVKPAETAEKK
jgi:hypothetical protein